MYRLPKEPRKIRELIRRYERKIRQEKDVFGRVHDGAGKRHLLGPLYMLMGDLDGALRSFRWFEEEFPDDCGDPGQYLCWALALYRSGEHDTAARRLRQAMLMNLYLVPHLLGLERQRIDMWHGSNVEKPDYLDEIPPEYFSLWDRESLQWASELYQSAEFKTVEARYIEIHRELLHLRPGSRWSSLVDEARKLSE